MPMATKEQQRAYQREWVKRRRLEWVAANGPCAMCGSSSELEVDHKISSEKSMATSSIWSLSKTNPRRIRELEKCRVLCRPCHLLKTKSAHEYARGIRSARVTLTESDVKAIRRLSDAGVFKSVIATAYGISRRHVHSICARTAWAHVT